MATEPEDPAERIERLERCINDLVSVLALPAVWIGRDPPHVVRSLLDVQLRMLRLDLVYVRLTNPIGEAPIEMARVAPSVNLPDQPREIGALLDRILGPEPRQWAAPARHAFGGEDMSVVPFRLGLQGEIGTVVAVSRRADFPGEIERLVLSVAANQAAIGLQEARLLSEQKRVDDELDRRVAQRTRELAAANAALTREIAERRLTEESLRREARELKRSEAFLAEAQQLSQTGSFGWRVATGEITWSEQLYRIFEFDQAVPVTLERIGTRVHPEDLPSLNDMLARARAAGGDFELEHRLLMPDDSVKYLRLTAHASRDRDGQLEYIGAAQDVTQRRLSEDALGQLRSELAQVARATGLGVLAASIAHEVNQPLSGIVTNASTCLRMLAGDPPNIDGARETAKRTIRDANRASDVIVRLRALFAKTDTPTESIDLSEATREVVALSLAELHRSHVILRLELADDLPPVLGDRVQLQQVIVNLLRNASDAMKDVVDRPRQLVVRTERDDGDRVRLSVRDLGTGFEPQATSELFEAFHSTKRGGMGIGLSVSRSIIERHRGRLWATPNEGPGATVSFSIPQWPGGAADRQVPSATPTCAATRSPRTT